MMRDGGGLTVRDQNSSRAKLIWLRNQYLEILPHYSTVLFDSSLVEHVPTASVIVPSGQGFKWRPNAAYVLYMQKSLTDSRLLLSNYQLASYNL